MDAPNVHDSRYLAKCHLPVLKIDPRSLPFHRPQ